MLKISPRLVVGSLLALALVGPTAAAPSAAAAKKAAAGIEFNLRTVEGGSITAEMLRGDVVVLAFGASWLPLSRTQVADVQRLADEYKDRDVRVYWVSADSDKAQSKNYATDEQLRSFTRKNGLKVGVLRDPDGAFFKTLGVERNQLPAVVILDREGNVSETVGGFDPGGNLVKQLSAQLNRLLTAQ